jgi:peptide-methionine (S)-S-oxide reductase
MLFRRLSIGLLIALSIGAVLIYQSSHSKVSGDKAKLTSSQLEPTLDVPAPKTTGLQTAVFAGGCFWGIEAVFEQLKGVSHVVSGYSGGSKNTANYETVSRGETGHAEAVQIVYDPAQISYGQLLKVFLLVAHDPTQLNRQDPDEGTQYRSAIFFTNNDQKRLAQAYISQLDRSHIFAQPIVTQITSLQEFYPAEKYHQDFIAHHPTHPYVVVNDLPKLNRLRQEFRELVKGLN